VSIGSDVAAARAAAGRTLDDVAQATRVRAAVIDRIEHDDFSLCGGDVYARGHLRAIGHALDVDPEPWVAAYDAQHAPEVAPLDLVEQHEVRERGRTPNWTSAMALALAAIVGFGVWSAVSGGGDDAPTTSPGTVAGQTRPAVPETSAPAKPAVTVQPDRDAVASVDQVTLTLTAKEGKSWVSVSDSSGDPLYQGTMEVGQRKSFRDDTELSLVVGNGAAVALTVNGQDLGAPGGQGEVVRLTFGPGDPSAG
jgi:cytoskeletal protein RodZ